MPINTPGLQQFKAVLFLQEAARQPYDRTLDRPMAHDLVVTSGYMTQTLSGQTPYKAVLEHSDGSKTYHPCTTMRAGEAFIRSEIPMPRDVLGLRRSANRSWGLPPTSGHGPHRVTTELK